MNTSDFSNIGDFQFAERRFDPTRVIWTPLSITDPLRGVDDEALQAYTEMQDPDSKSSVSQLRRYLTEEKNNQGLWLQLVQLMDSMNDIDHIQWFANGLLRTGSNVDRIAECILLAVGHALASLRMQEQETKRKYQKPSDREIKELHNLQDACHIVYGFLSGMGVAVFDGLPDEEANENEAWWTDPISALNTSRDQYQCAATGFPSQDGTQINMAHIIPVMLTNFSSWSTSIILALYVIFPMNVAHDVLHSC
ncbi:MAG: hypothetical protein M1821_009259 [Bathelium mastoideum]|nr:MAG: hypothetical protein M1821_009259 [Bathelium mastoideum]